MAFMCTKCGTAFPTSQKLQRHSLRKRPCDPVLDTPEALHNRCRFCGRVYSRPDSLKRHLGLCDIANGGAEKLCEHELRVQRGHFNAELAKRDAAFEAELAKRDAAFEAELAKRDAAFEAELAKRDAAFEAELVKRNAAFEAELAKCGAAFRAELAKRDTRAAAVSVCLNQLAGGGRTPLAVRVQNPDTGAGGRVPMLGAQPPFNIMSVIVPTR